MADDAAAPEGELTEPPEDTADTPDAADDAGTEESDTEESASEESEESSTEETSAREPMSPAKLALVCGVVGVVALAALCGWLGFRTYQERNEQALRDLYVQVGRQGAINLTTIDFEHVDDDVKRIVDSSTGSFYDEFQQRAAPFAGVVKQLQSKSSGTVSEAGLESATDTDGVVLVTVTVNSSMAGQPELAPRYWRMRISVQKVGEGDVKVSNVEFR